MKNNLVDRFLNARKSALSITSPLKLEDYVIQSRPEASPAKWHLAHTTWLYEKLLLENFEKNFIPFNRDYFYLFNSYYNSFGEQWNRNDRGNLSRPTLDEIIQYRKNVDQRVTDLDFNNSKLLELFTLAINHEEQHNELLLMDIKLNFFQQYPKVSYLNETIVKIENVKKIEKSEFKIFDEGLFEFGINKNEIFSYDNENPKHKVWLHPFAIYTNLVTNGEYLEFVESNGYKRSELWHSDGLKWIKQNEINSPLYWFKENNEWYEFKLSGIDKLDLEAPCMHISFYEAAAFARFKGLRLPTEYEWERASQEILSDQNSFLNLMSLEGSLPQLENNFMGTLWQWTNSSYLPYPGHIWEEGPLGEYNSKFMLNQMVLRGGSFGTNREHFRTTYRNFFYPHERWMFSGFRLAKDIR